MPLKSGIYKKFRRNFLLDEDGLRRIVGVLEEARKRYTDENLLLEYRVERSDDRFYETDSIDDVLSDPNIEGSEIRALALYLRSAEKDLDDRGPRSVSVAVFFDSDFEPLDTRNDVVASVSSPDRTWSLMLADELEPQIRRTFQKKSSTSWMYAVLFFLTLPVALKLRELFGGERVDGFLSWLKVILTASMLTLGAAVVHFVVSQTPRVRRKIGLDSFFEWGGQASAYKDKKAVRNNVKWGILIALVISIVAGIYTSNFLSFSDSQ